MKDLIILILLAVIIFLVIVCLPRSHFGDSFTLSDSISVRFQERPESYSLDDSGIKRYFPELHNALTLGTDEPDQFQFGVSTHYLFYDGPPEKGKIIGKFRVDKKVPMEYFKTVHRKYNKISVPDPEAYFDFQKTVKDGVTTITVKYHRQNENKALGHDELSQKSEEKSDYLFYEQPESVDYRASSSSVPIYCVKTDQIVPVVTNEKGEETLGPLEPSRLGSSIMQIRRNMPQARYLYQYRGMVYE